MPRSFALVLLLPLLLTGCVAAAVGAGTETGVSLAEERSLGTKVDDSVIYTDVTNRLIKAGGNLFVNVNVRVRAQRVMLTGIVASEDLARKAVSVTWQAKGVKEVINELVISTDDGFMNSANDALIQKNLESRLFLTKNVWVINYSINVVNGTVYLLGRTHDRAELERVLSVTRSTKGVKRVVSHLIVKTEMPGVEDSAPSTGADPATAAPYQPASTSSSTSSAPATNDSINHYAPGQTDGTIGIDSVSTTDLPAAK